MTFGAKEAQPKANKQADGIWRIISLVDVNSFLALCVNVEERREEPRSVCVRRLWMAFSW